MQSDPLVEWQRLTETYTGMYDDELLNLAADSVDLTEVARQVLRDEMKRRGLEEPRTERGDSQRPATPLVPQSDLGGTPSYAEEGDQDSDLPHEYTWKTPLCECNDQEKALQLSEALRRAGIESWIERPGSRRAVVWDERMVGNLQMLVAADRLDQAREVAARPIPQEIVDQSKTRVPEFEPPVCPKCEAEDPVLEGVDPSNTWKCEACEFEWTESTADLSENP